ncbi:MAG: lysylphosphatidylglycerol synthase transmembrane domain-containing protein, partial [Gaiellaceae bacterium]
MKVGRRSIAIVVGLVSLAGVALLVQRTGTSAIRAAATPDWRFLLAGLAICAAVQPLRALAWNSTVREPEIGFRAMYTASSVGSFLDTVLPGRLGEASKVAVLKVTAGPRWPGFSRAGGSLLCAHLLEMIAFVLVGAGSAFFLPVPFWAKMTMIVGLPLAAGGLVLVSVLHRRLSHRLPQGVGAFLAGGAVPKKIMLRAGLILIVTWVARWFGLLFLLHAVGVHVGVGSALLYMVVTGLANTMPALPGNVGIYQGAAIGAL